MIGRRLGYIDKTGKIIINPQFDTAGAFNEGIAIVSTGGKFGYIDKTGKIFIPCQFDDAGLFQEGLAMIKIGGKRVILIRQAKSS